MLYSLLTECFKIRAYFSAQLITICAVVKSKCAVEKGNVCTQKCRDSG